MPAPALLLPLALAAGSAVAGGLSAASRKKTPGRFEQVPNRSPQQIDAQNQALQMALSGLKNPTAGFEPIEQQQVKRFNEQTVPSLAERFTSMGGGQRSSAFAGALGNAGSDLGGQLAALKAQYGLQNSGQLQQLLGQGLQPQFDTAYHKPTDEDTPLSGALGGLSQGLGFLSSGYGGAGFGGGSGLGGQSGGRFGALGQQMGGQQLGGLGSLIPQQKTAGQDVAQLQAPQQAQPGFGQQSQQQSGGQQGQANFEDFLRKYLSGMK